MVETGLVVEYEHTAGASRGSAFTGHAGTLTSETLAFEQIPIKGTLSALIGASAIASHTGRVTGSTLILGVHELARRTRQTVELGATITRLARIRTRVAHVRECVVGGWTGSVAGVGEQLQVPCAGGTSSGCVYS